MLIVIFVFVTLLYYLIYKPLDNMALLNSISLDIHGTIEQYIGLQQWAFIKIHELMNSEQKVTLNRYLIKY